MSSIQMLQFFWPTLQSWPPFNTFMKWVDASSFRRRAPFSLTPCQNIEPFARALMLSVEADIKSVGARGRVDYELKIFVCPPLDAQQLLFLLVSALVNDSLTHSLDPNVACYFRICLDSNGEEIRLLVEDDGWVPRSITSWQSHNQISRELVQAGGGQIYCDMEWACNRVTVVFPL